MQLIVKLYWDKFTLSTVLGLNF